MKRRLLVLAVALTICLTLSIVGYLQFDLLVVSRTHELQPMVEIETQDAIRARYSRMYNASIEFVNSKLIPVLPKHKKLSLLQARNALDAKGGVYMVDFNAFPENLANSGFGDFTGYLRDQLWLEYNLSDPTLVIGNMLDASCTGNTLSRYFQLMAFANRFGMDFLMTGKYPFWDEKPLKEGDKESFRVTFLSFLPWYRTSDSDKKFDSQEAVNAAYACTAWEGNFPHLCVANEWQYFTRQSRQVIQAALQDYHEFYGKKDMIASDVAVHFRCGDIYGAAGDEYGVLTRSYYRQSIPKSATKISILAQPTKNQEYCKLRESDCVNVDLCEAFLETTIGFLQEDFPNAEISIFDNDTVTESFTRMANSKVLVCSLSTYCFWAGVASNGQVSFPKEEKLIVMADWDLLGENFHFVDQYQHLKPSYFFEELHQDVLKGTQFIEEN